MLSLPTALRAGLAALVAAMLLDATVSPQQAQAGDYSIKSWGVDEGLPQSSVTDIVQTRDGYIWLGTLLAGLSRFDGARFVNFDAANTPGFINPGIRRLLVDCEGILWVNDYGNNLLQWKGDRLEFAGIRDVALGSLVANRPGRITFSTLEAELVRGERLADGTWKWQRIKPPERSGNLYYHEDKEGVLWYRAPGSKLGRLVGDKFELLAQPPGLRSKEIQVLARDEAGEIWVGTNEELAHWDGHRFVDATPPGNETKVSVHHIIKAGPGAFWVEANGTFRLWAAGRWQNEVAGWDGATLPWSRTRTLREDNAGGMWISLREEGLAHVRADGSLARITGADGLPSQLVQAFYTDAEGNLWTGYHRGGLVQVRQRLFHPIARAEGLQDTVVTSLSEDTAGGIWVGTAGGSVARWFGGACTNFSLPLKGSFSQDVVVSAGPDGRVWVGAGGNGLLVFEQERFRHVVDPKQLPQSVRLLLAAKNGRVWFANFTGLYYLKNDKPEQVLAAKSFSEIPAALAEGTKGSLWVGTMGGKLLHWVDGQWHRYAPADSLPASRFWALLPEPDGTVWVGTMEQGLLRFRNGAFARVSKADGLPDNSISQILTDDDGHFWLGSRAGVLRVSRRELEAWADGRSDALACRVFGRGDGLLTVALTLEFEPNCLRGHDGLLWFGSANGISWVRPRDLNRRQAAPPVVIESASADGKVLSLAAVSPNGTIAPAPRPPRVVLEPGVKTFEVHFTAPNFIAPELIRYKYQLQGLDTDWLPAGNRRTITYTRLPPGTFTFRVTAENSDGVWNEEGASFELAVLPHLWERPTFIIACLALAAGALALTVRTVTKRRLNRKLERLERQRELERERARIAQDLHDDLGAGLTEISLTSDLAQDPVLAPEQSREYVHEIGGRARELVQNMDEIVWAVNPRNDSVVSLAAYICQYAQRLLKPAGIRCRLDVQEHLPAIPFNAEQRYQLFLAFKEAVNNVARHSQATEARLAIRLAQDTLCLDLQDDGRGFEPGTAAEGADGLRNMQERLARLGGRCTIQAQPSGGVRVEFRLPLAVPARSV